MKFSLQNLTDIQVACIQMINGLFLATKRRSYAEILVELGTPLVIVLDAMKGEKIRLETWASSANSYSYRTYTMDGDVIEDLSHKEAVTFVTRHEGQILMG